VLLEAADLALYAAKAAGRDQVQVANGGCATMPRAPVA
jgi:predicted signal transduction protein with EAL and GGDEF domain